MGEQSPAPFARLLRQLRAAAGMTQEQLADAAGLSPRSVSDLERGINMTARRETARLLAEALNLTGARRAEFELAARGRPAAENLPVPGAEVAGGLAVATRTLPRDAVWFTGRGSELRWLMGAASEKVGAGGAVGIYAIGGMAGVGKTAFAVHSAHLLAPQFPDGQIFLPLHGHTHGQRPIDPAEALASLLQTAGVAVQQIPQGLEARVRLWRDHLAGKRLLIVLDDAIGHDQVRPLLPGTAGSLVLITSRRHLTALDARAMSLDTLPPGEAAELLIRLADRPGLDQGDVAVAEISRLSGYLPLAVGLLARQLHHHPAWTPADLAADLAAARDRLELMHAENLSVAAAFDLSYQDLTTGQQQLLRRLAMHPGTDIDVYATAALADTDLPAARRCLEALYDQHLLAEPTHGRYRLHDLIREHTRAMAAVDPALDRGAAFSRLLDYYRHTAQAADQHLGRRTPAQTPAANASRPAETPDLLTREDAVIWMDAERVNLHSVVVYAATHGQVGEAAAIPAAMDGYMRSHGYWHQALTLHRAVLDAACRDGDRQAEAIALAELGDTQHLTGDYPAAITSLTRALELYRGLGDPLGESGVLHDLGFVQRLTGDHKKAAASLARALDLYCDLRDRLGEAVVRTELGYLQHVTGDYRAAAASLTRALGLCRDIGYQLGEARTLNFLGIVQHLPGDGRSASTSLFKALDLHRSLGYQLGEARVLSDIGVLQSQAGSYPAATSSATRALELYRDLSFPLGEVRALNVLGTVQCRTGHYRAAAASMTRALNICLALGYRLGEAEVRNNMAELSLASAQPADAQRECEQALTIARSVGAPSEEARALEGIGQCHRRNGHLALAADQLRQALAIYRRIGSRRADQVETTMRNYGL